MAHINFNESIIIPIVLCLKEIWLINGGDTSFFQISEYDIIYENY